MRGGRECYNWEIDPTELSKLNELLSFETLPSWERRAMDSAVVRQGGNAVVRVIPPFLAELQDQKLFKTSLSSATDGCRFLDAKTLKVQSPRCAKQLKTPGVIPQLLNSANSAPQANPRYWKASKRRA